MAVSVRGNPEPGPLTRCVMLGQRADVAAFSDPESQPSKPPTENTAGSLITRFLETQPGFFFGSCRIPENRKKNYFVAMSQCSGGYATDRWPQSLCHLFVGQKQFTGRSPGSVTCPSPGHAHGQRRHHAFGTNTEVANLHPGTGMETQTIARLARKAPCRDPLVPSSVPTSVLVLSVAVLVLVLETAF